MGATGALRGLFVALVLIVLNSALAYETFRLLAVPPAASLDNLSDGRVIITGANVKLKVIRACLGLDVTVALIENLVQFLHQSNVDRKQELRLLELGCIEHHPVALWYRNVKMLKQLDDRWLLKFEFLFKQAHNNLVDLVNCLINDVLPQMLEGWQLGWFKLRHGILLGLYLGHAIIVPVVVVVILFLLALLLVGGWLLHHLRLLLVLVSWATR